MDRDVGEDHGVERIGKAFLHIIVCVPVAEDQQVIQKKCFNDLVHQLQPELLLRNERSEGRQVACECNQAKELESQL